MIQIERNKKLLGWCPQPEMSEKVKSEHAFSYVNDTTNELMAERLRLPLVGLHLTIAFWLISTAIKVMSNPQIFPWWTMNINFVATGLILVIGSISLLLAFNL